MRVQCCKCGCKFDVPIRYVLAEAEKLAGKRKAPEPTRPDVAIDGNVLPTGDADAVAAKATALARRSPNGQRT